MDHVMQKHANGCGPACLAMVLGKSYDEVIGFWQDKDFRTDAIHEGDLRDVLQESGFYYQIRYRYTQIPKRNTERPWPCAPFADTHICQVRTTVGAHFVVMDATGRVYDPAISSRTSLSEYEEVYFILGLFAQSKLTQAEARIEALVKACHFDGVSIIVRSTRLHSGYAELPLEIYDNIRDALQAFAKLLNGGYDAH